MRKIKYIQDSVKSPLHDKNEDKAFVIKTDGYSLCFLFDGVGSATHAFDAVGICFNFISENYKKFERGDKYQLSDLMFNTHVQLIGSKLPEVLSTYVAMYIPNQENQPISISSMGDSRAYGISNQYVNQYTKDDSISNIDNVITKCLGMSELKITDFRQKDFIPKESRYLIASDGFYKLMEKNIQNFYKFFNFTRLANIKNALHKATINNNEDDASYILIEIYV